MNTKPETPFIVTRELAVKVHDTVKKGLVKGLGVPKVGAMCVEAAVCFAMGMPHSDNPTCVAPSFRTWKIGINDSNWSSAKARGDGMLAVAIAQLGSKDSVDEVKFAQALALNTIKVIVPLALREAAKVHPSKDHKVALERNAQACENVVDLSAASYAARDAASAASAASYAASYAASAASYAASAASAASYAASYAARAASYAASAASAASYAASDKVLQTACDIGLQAMKDVCSPGCQFLDLIEEK